MENNKEQVVEQENKSTPFLKRVSELEKKVELMDKKLNTIISALKSRR